MPYEAIDKTDRASEVRNHEGENMNVILSCKKFIDQFNDQYLLVFEQGNPSEPILMLSEKDMTMLNKEWGYQE